MIAGPHEQVDPADTLQADSPYVSRAENEQGSSPRLSTTALE